MPSDCLGQVDFPVGQVTFHSHLPNGQGPRQVIRQLNRKNGNLRLPQGMPKGKLEFNFFLSPGIAGHLKPELIKNKLILCFNFGNFPLRALPVYLKLDIPCLANQIASLLDSHTCVEKSYFLLQCKVKVSCLGAQHDLTLKKLKDPHIFTCNL